MADCYSQAQTSSEEGSAVGGLVGLNTGNVTRCYASGIVSAHNYTGGMADANYGTITNAVSLNSRVDANTTATRYNGRFGGNDNSQNSTADVLAWPGMLSNGWGNFAHHADNHGLDLTALATYKGLGWDFDNTWEWRTNDSGKYFAFLRGVDGQKMPDN